jgi:excisionase family DNA binding protein
MITPVDESKKTRSGVLTMREAAEVLRCSKAHVSNIINRKVPGLPTLPVVRIGRRLLVRRDALDRWLLSVER